MSQTLAFSSNQGAYFAGQVESHRPVSIPLDRILHPLEHGKIYLVLNQVLRDQVCQFPESHLVDSSYADKDPALPLNKTNKKFRAQDNFLSITFLTISFYHDSSLENLLVRLWQLLKFVRN